MSHRLDVFGIDFVQNVDVTEHLAELGRQRLLFRIGQFEPGQRRDFRNVIAGQLHGHCRCPVINSKKEIQAE